MRPTVTFAPLDFAVLAVFCAGLLALGFSARLRSNSILQFLAAGRALSMPVYVASLVSLWYGDVLGTGEAVPSFGIGTWVLFGVPYYVFAVLYALYFAKRVRQADQLSIPERLDRAYGRNVALAGAALVFLLAVPAAPTLALATLVQAVSGWGLLTSIAVGAVGGSLFLYKGGLLADARVSLLSFGMMYVGFAMMAAWCVYHHPAASILPILKAQGLLKWDGGAGIAYVFSLFIVGAWTFVDPGFHQRVASAVSPEVGKNGVLVCVLFWILFDVLAITTGLYAVALNPGGQGLQVFPAFAEAILPAGIKAVFFCGMLGAVVSATVGYMLVSGITVGREIVARLRPGLSDERITALSRYGVAFGCAAGMAVAVSIRSIVDIWTNWAGALIGAMLIPVCAAFLARRPTFKPSWIVSSMAASFLFALGWMAYGMMHGDPYLEVVVARTGQGLRFVLPSGTSEPEGIKMAVGTLAPGLLVSALTLSLGTILSKRGTTNA